METEFIRNRITELRIKKGVSEHRMSLDLGHCRSYIHGIVTGKSLPSMTEFLYICDYLEVAPELFFKVDESSPVSMTKLIEEVKTLSEDDILMLLGFARRMKK